MPKQLIIVESPTKARTISRFLGNDFLVESSYGHVRDLPKSKLGVDVEHDFAPQYIIPLKARAHVKKLKKDAAKAKTVILATDEDREGEAIAWHLVTALDIGPEKTGRIVFHEITKSAIADALQHPRAIDMRMVDAQQARRILDRLVGYKLSPFLWKKVFRGLSAGRVQSAAMRLLVEREREIQNFTTQEYWTITASLLTSPLTDNAAFDATLIKINDETLDKFAIKTGAEAREIASDLSGALWRVGQVEKRAMTKNPPSPFTTSTLQQDAFRRLGFSAKQTMFIAQQLYEGLETGDEGPVGLITYMRTDSLNIAASALAEASALVKKEFGVKYVLPSPRRFKTKSKGAQEAHEAIRPTDPWRKPEQVKPFLDAKQFRLYELIWKRFVAGQMPPAIFDASSVDIQAARHTDLETGYTFRATGQVLRFDGFLKVYPTQFTENPLPELTPKEELTLQELKPEQHFTAPPARFTEATLVKTLEQYGIGRPSTYAPIISTIQDRGYAQRHERRYLKPTETGFLVNDLLVEHFPAIVDIQFTARMEEELDEIASGKTDWPPVIRRFYDPFAQNLAAKYESVKKHEVPETTEEICDKCGRAMIVKMGRFGKFLACSGFPECKNTKTLGQKEKATPQKIDMRCPKCQEGDVIIRYTKRRKMFYGCSRYPACDWASWNDPRKETPKQ